MIRYIFQDYHINKKNTKGKVIAILFRMASYIASRKFLKLILFPYLIFYRLFVEWILGIELPWGTEVGSGLKIYHGQATIVNKNVKIGRNCIIRQCTTIGNAVAKGGCPVIGNDVEIGSNVCILGDITIGDKSIIGAGAVVVKSIPPFSVVVGNPARIIKVLQ